MGLMLQLIETRAGSKMRCIDVLELSRPGDIAPVRIPQLLDSPCIDSAVRDACDLGYLVTKATDACATLSRDRHDWSLRNARGYSRQRTTAKLVAEIERLTAAR